jgi:hypothetical protein
MWLKRVQQLTRRLIRYQENNVIHKDLAETPVRIEALISQLTRETKPEFRREIEETLTSHRQNLKQLNRLKELMRRAELDLEEIVASMGTIYAQLRVLEAIEIKSRRVRRLSHEIEEQIDHLDDLIQATDEVYRRSFY